jgi:hypothetical protein
MVLTIDFAFIIMITLLEVDITVFRDGENGLPGRQGHPVGS